jgi:hypothetical protein
MLAALDVIARPHGAGYNIVLVLHILAAMVAVAPGFVWPVVSVALKKAGKPVGPAIGDLAAGNTAKVHGPALVLTGILGIGLISMSKVGDATEGFWQWDQTWVMVSLLLWFIAMGLVFGLMMPAEKKAATGDEGAEKLISAVGGGLHLVLALLLIMMVFKPGL